MRGWGAWCGPAGSVHPRYWSHPHRGFPRWSAGKESACNGGFDSWVGKISWRRKWQRSPVFLPERSHGQRSLAGYRVARDGHNGTTKPPASAYVCDSQTPFLSFGGSGAVRRTDCDFSLTWSCLYPSKGQSQRPLEQSL